MLTLALRLTNKKNGLITPISSFSSLFSSDRILTRKNESILHVNNNNNNFKKNISNINKKDTSFLKKYFYKNLLLTNSRITSTQKNNRIDSVYLAKQFIETLTQDEKNIIKEQLILAEQEQTILSQATTSEQKITFHQLMLVSLQSGLPFIGFGFVDNFIMICAGDIIETYIGFWIPVSTMAAAGLGNAISDVAGIGLAHHIEYYCSKLINVPKLTAEDWQRPIVHWCHIISKSICIFLGCLIGMFPLIFIQHEKKDNKTVDK